MADHPSRTVMPRIRQLGVLVVATTANYLWQVPYAVHQYGWAWAGLPKLSAGRLFSGVWFAIAIHRYVTGRRFGWVMLITFLLVEVVFYLLHNLTGAFLADLPVTNPIVLIASILGYANLLIAMAYLWLLRRRPSQEALSQPGRSGAPARRPRRRT